MAPETNCGGSRHRTCNLSACSLPAQCCSALQMVPGVFSSFFFSFSCTGIFILLSFTLWACGCLLQPLVPAGAGRREGWEEISATIRQMMQGPSTVHEAMLLVKPNHVSETGQGTISHQETWRLGWLSPSAVPPGCPPSLVPHTDGVPTAGAGLEHGRTWPSALALWWCGWQLLHHLMCWMCLDLSSLGTAVQTLSCTPWGIRGFHARADLHWPH